MALVLCVATRVSAKIMSWIVEVILLDRYNLPENPSIDFIGTNIYNDTTSVIEAIDDLMSEGVFSAEDVVFLDLVSSFGKFSLLENELGMQRNAIARKFKDLCGVISFYLGGWFTNEGFLEHMQNKYDLSDIQIELAREFMESSERYSIKKERYFNKNFLLIGDE